MQKCANELCSIHEYDLYENTLQGIKKLGVDIINYQRILRENMNERDLEYISKFKEIKEKEFEEK